MEARSSSSSNGGNPTPLASLFSEEAKKKFARIVPPAEDAHESELDGASAAQEGSDHGEDSGSEEAEDAMDEESAENRESRTIFVGNVPVTESKKSLNRLFAPCGSIESIRLRSVPIEGVKVQEAGNQKLVRKICVNQKKFGEQKGSFNAYIRFKDEQSVAEALKLNNTILNARHLRVDTSVPSRFEPNRTVFVGNIPYLVDEEELRTHFAAALPNGQEDILAVRIVRDAETLVGKGFCYILFSDRTALVKALGLNKSMFKEKWELRVTTFSTKQSSQSAKGKGKSKSRSGSEGSRSSKTEASDPHHNVVSKNATHALKRLKRKGVVTKKKLMKTRKPRAEKASSGRKTKK